MKKFILIQRYTLESFDFDEPKNLAMFLWGKDINEFIIIKDENRVVKLVSPELKNMEYQLRIS